MTGENHFSEVITTEAQLREIIGYPAQHVIGTMVSELDDLCHDYISQSPFVLIASADAQGNIDVSPKGDPPGFVQALDDKTLLIPDRPGNRRADTFTNILQNPHVGLLFMIPGNRETLRICGQAQIIRDTNLRQRMTMHGKVPELVIAVQVDQAFFHCPRCIIRADLWEAASDTRSYRARAVVQYGGVTAPVDQVEQMLDDDAQAGLY